MDPEQRRANQREYHQHWRRNLRTPEQQESARKREQEHYDARRAAGICQSCPNKSRPGRTRCAECAERYRNNTNAKRTKADSSDTTSPSPDPQDE